MVALKGLGQVELSVHRVVKPIEDRVNDEHLPMGYIVHGIHLAGFCYLYHRCHFDDGRLGLLGKSFPACSPGINVRVGVERRHF